MSATGELLRRARKAKRLTQKQVAVALGVTQGNVSQWESGAVRPESWRVSRIVAVYGLTRSSDLSDAIAADVEATKQRTLSPESRPDE